MGEEMTNEIDFRDVADNIRKERKEMPCEECETIRTKHGGFGPPHTASRNCESGKRNHCTCDVCF